MKVSLITLKMTALVMGLCVLALFTGYQLGSRTGLLIALVVAIGWLTLLWTSDEARWLNEFSLRPLKGQDAWGILKIVEEGSARMHSSSPEVYLVHSRSAFSLSLSLGLHRESLLISQGLIENLSAIELRAVIFSELASLHLRTRVRYRWVHLMARSWVRLFEILESLFPFGKKLQILRTLSLPFNFLILKMGFWKSFELERDQITISLMDDRKPLASAISKLVALGQVYPMRPPAGSQHLFIVNPGRSEDEEHFLALHSPLRLRLRRILGAETI